MVKILTILVVQTLHLTVATQLSIVANSFTLAAKLKQVLRTRSPPKIDLAPDQDCRIVCMIKSTDLLSAVHVSSGFFQTKQILLSRQFIDRSTQDFKLSPTCVHIIVETSFAFEIQTNRKWVNDHIMNLKQESVHFLTIGLESEVLSFLRTDAYDALKYKTALTWDTNEILIGDGGLYERISEVNPLPSEAQLLRGRTMALMIWKLEPLVVHDTKGSPAGGFSYQHGFEFCTYYNVSCTYEIDFHALQHPNRTWRGFMHKLIEGEGDALFGNGVIASRYGPTDVTISTLFYEVRFFTSHPRSTVKWQALFYPLDLTVWLTILIVSLVLIPIYIAHFQFSLSLQPLGWSEALYESMAIPFGLLLQECIPIPQHAKLLTVVFVFYSLLIANYYSSNLISFLTFPEKDTLPTTITELAEARHKFNIGLTHNPGSIQSSYFMETSNPEAALVREVLDWNRDWLDCIRKVVVNYNFVCIALKFSADMYAAKNFTLTSGFYPYLESKDVILSIPQAVATSWNSRYYTVWNRNTVWMFDTGHVNKWKENALSFAYAKSRPWMREQLTMNSPLAESLLDAMQSADTSALKAFTLGNFRLCFGSWFAGLTFGMLAFFLELSLMISNRFWVAWVSSVKVF